MLRTFIDNIELWLSGAGLLVVWVASVIIAPGGADIWQVAAITALVVSVLHGLIFWGVRRRQRRVRREAIADIREMLSDRVKNQLAVVQMGLQSSEADSEVQMQLEMIGESVDNIAELVDGLSEDSLRSWKVHYDEAVRNTTDLAPAAG